MSLIKKFLKSIDFWTIIIVLILFAIGIVALFSANGGIEGSPDETYKQLVWFGVSFALMLIMTAIDYEVLGRLWLPLYAIMILMLFLVLFTAPINGATSWFQFKGVSIQPSEFSKIILIIVLAKNLEKLSKNKKINSPISLLVLLIIIAIPTFLIIKQPDYGTAMVILAIFAFMIYAAGISMWYVGGALLLASVSLPFIYLYVLPEHAKNRIMVFLNPQIDPQGAGYNIIQSMMAVRVGRTLGDGLV